jgi:hypothetical protein
MVNLEQLGLKSETAEDCIRRSCSSPNTHLYVSEISNGENSVSFHLHTAYAKPASIEALEH